MSPRFGLSFIDGLLLAISAGGLENDESEAAWSRARQRASDARKALFGESADGGCPPHDDDWELLEVGHWVRSYLGLTDKAPDEQPPVSIIKKAVRQVAKETFRASAESRRRTLERKFIKEWQRIMKVIEEQAFDDSKDAYYDLQLIGEIFKRQQIAFDFEARALKERLAARLKRAPTDRKSAAKKKGG